MTAVVARIETYVAEVVDAVDAVVPVAGAYVLGSGLLGGFDPAASDLDVVVVVERPLDADERAGVRRAQDELAPPVRRLELVVYAAGARPPAYELNYPDGDGEPVFWFVLDAAIAQERSQPLRGRPWRELLEPVTQAETRRAAEEMLRWAEERDDEPARPHAIRARHYLEHGTWMTKEEARR
ncbi:MAG TPA: nucleotidyltransferase domain-containing protein [Gaiellaceae bacterium]|nr:nucleotidyltransferase domain-containing protein [Gaiellaceae bacterium]